MLWCGFIAAIPDADLLVPDEYATFEDPKHKPGQIVGARPKKTWRLRGPDIVELDADDAAGMRVLVTLPWAKHIEFLRERSTRKDIAEAVRAAVSANAGHPAIFGYLVGNEISSTMTRWLGALARRPE